MRIIYVRRRSTSAPIEDAPPAPSPIGSLASRRAIYSRNGIVWSSVRAWRSDMKRSDVQALKAAKQAVDAAIIAGAAAELAGYIRMTFGPLTGWTVSTVAVGHSRRPDSFAVRLAESVAAGLGLPFEKIFADRFVTGVSHPKEFSKLPPLQRVVEPNRPILLVDDVATSGWHLEEAITNLRGAGAACFAVTWISGTIK